MKSLTPAKPTGAQSVDRAMGLLKLVAQGPGDGVRLAELADLAGQDRATAHRLLSSLVRHGLVDQDAGSRRYTLGLEFFSLAAAASNRIDLAEVARGALRDLCADTGDTATVCLRSGPNLVCMDVQTGHFPIKALPMDVGSHRPLGAGATGVALLAGLPDAEVEQVLRTVAARLAGVPGQERAAVLAAVAQCRVAGYALGPEEPEGRILGLAVALVNRRGRAMGTLTLHGIAERLASGRVPELAAAVTARARAIDEAMSRMPDETRHRSRWSPL